MREVNATDFRDQFEAFLDLARDEPIGIRKSGKLTTVMVSAEQYEQFQKLEDGYWAARAEAAELRGQQVEHEEAMRLLGDRLKQPK